MAFDALLTALDADLIEPVRSKAYDDLGNGRRAHSIAVAWFPPTLFGQAARRSWMPNAASGCRDARVYAKNAVMAAVSSENAQRSAILPPRT
jgi:hypothetical protein